MAKDYLNVIERALMMGISDKINNDTASGSDIYVYGEFPETEEIQFPAIIVQMIGSGFEEQFFDPGEIVEMPVSFFIDPSIKDDKFMGDLQELTLSYTMFVE